MNLERAGGIDYDLDYDLDYEKRPTVIPIAGQVLFSRLIEWRGGELAGLVRYDSSPSAEAAPNPFLSAFPGHMQVLSMYLQVLSIHRSCRNVDNCPYLEVVGCPYCR